MKVLWKTVIITCFIAITIPSIAGQRCKGGVECILLSDCTNLYNQLQQGTNPSLTRLLRSLHCGFLSDQPKSINTGFPVGWEPSSVQQVRRSQPRKNRKRPPGLQMKPVPRPIPQTKPVPRPIPQKKPVSRPIPQRKPVSQSKPRPIVPRPSTHTATTVKPANKKVCCPPHFQEDSSSTSTLSTNNRYPTRNPGNSNSDNPSRYPSNSGSSNSNNGYPSSNDEREGVSTSNAESLLPDRRRCGIQNDERIVGGSQTELDEHPWMVLIRYDKPYGWGFYCGGVLISSRYVLTAAHCLKGDDLPSNWRISQVRLGEWNTSSTQDCVADDCAGPVQDIPVEEIIAHEGYDPHDANQHNDIALLRLSRPAAITDFVKPICLPLSKNLRNNGFAGNAMEVAGWGKTETRSESDVKLKVQVPVVTISECEATFKRVGRQIINKQLCAGGNSGQDSCRGDSGGALMGRVDKVSNWFAFGVVSYGPSPCGTPGWPGVYTRVGAYVDWILSKLRS